jgi:hypothetical protein
LELDGYNQDEKIAFEYNGIQHYEVATWWNNTEDDLIKQQLHDKIKVDKCDAKGVELFVIPYFKTKKEIRTFILENLPNRILCWWSEKYLDEKLLRN